MLIASPVLILIPIFELMIMIRISLSHGCLNIVIYPVGLITALHPLWFDRCMLILNAHENLRPSGEVLISIAPSFET